MFEHPQTDLPQWQELGPEASVPPLPPVGTQTTPPGLRKAEPLVQRLFRKLRTSDACFSAMVYTFKKLQRWGLSVGPNHFYWPVPDLSEVERQRSRSDVMHTAVDLRLSHQLQFLRAVAAKYKPEWTFADQPDAEYRYHYNNGFFETVDAEIAYSFVRHFKPSRIIEVGGGFSTRVLAEALQANLAVDGVQGALTTIDPAGLDPSTAVLRNSPAELIQQPVQELDAKLFSSLEEGDILFLDSSHVVSVGSDVVYEYLEILPRLRKGVLIHAHDIFLPFDYPPALVDNLSFWNEQYLLLAFLSFNPCFEVLWSSSGMQTFHPDALGEMFPRWKDSYRKLPKASRRFVPSLDGERVWPSSFWMRRIF
jgi:predicted O-methyltransferase YrrM